MYNILIFGTGNLAKFAFSFLDLTQVTIMAFIHDNVSLSESNEFCNEKVIFAQNISDYDYDYIFIATAYYQTVTTKLLALGVAIEKIVHLNMLDHAIDEFWAQKGPAKGVSACLFDYIGASPIFSKIIIKDQLLSSINQMRWKNLDYVFAILSSHQQFSSLFSETDIINVCGIYYPKSVIERFKYYFCLTDILMSYCLLSEKQRNSINEETFLRMRPTRPGSIVEGYEFGPVYLCPGDTVIDCGASVGIFSGFAAHRIGNKGHVFSFEPIPYSLNYLKQTASCYNNISVIPNALHNTSTQQIFNSTLVESVPGAMSIVTESCKITGMEQEYISVRATSLDEWALGYNIDRIDFIKADIEGAERYMLDGAQTILQEMAPKLSLCKYHLPDDSTVLRKIITAANSKYVFIERGDVLFAYIP